MQTAALFVLFCGPLSSSRLASCLLLLVAPPVRRWDAPAPAAAQTLSRYVWASSFILSARLRGRRAFCSCCFCVFAVCVFWGSKVSVSCERADSKRQHHFASEPSFVQASSLRAAAGSVAQAAHTLARHRFFGTPGAGEPQAAADTRAHSAAFPASFLTTLFFSLCQASGASVSRAQAARE